jgi:DNA-directed RNA polymerase specialized sigma24 family protein
VQPDTIGKRLQAVAGAGALPGVPFDASRPPHVDRAARALLERFHAENDGAAFALLVEIAQPLLEGGAQQITRDLGLAIDPRDLVSAHLGRLYVDLRRPPHIPESFVDDALAAMDADAHRRLEALVNRVSDAWAAGGGGGSGGGTIAERLAGQFAGLVGTCFHSLDEADRRILIALEVDRLSYAQIAEQFGIYQDEVAQRIVEARGRLAARIAAVFTSIGPTRRELP